VLLCATVWCAVRCSAELQRDAVTRKRACKHETNLDKTYSSVLQYVAVRNSVLQCAAVCCTVFHCAALQCVTVTQKRGSQRELNSGRNYSNAFQCTTVC